MATYLDFAIKNREDLRNWILRSLGHPLVSVELTDDMITDSVNDAVELFTKYASQERSYVQYNLDDYVEGEGLVLPGNVMGIFALTDNMISTTSSSQGVNTLFSVPNQLWNADVIPTFGIGGGGSWVTYELSLQYLDLIGRLTGAGAGGGGSSFYFEYNERTKRLVLSPDPKKFNTRGYVVLGVNTIRPEDQQMGENWVKLYALALSKIKLGRVREKYNSVGLLGGGQIDTSVKDEGLSEKSELEERLVIEESFYGDFYVG